jgi:hypothetical protein
MSSGKERAVFSANHVLGDTPEVLELARRGDLSRYAAEASETERRRLTCAVYEIAWPLVFARLTRRMELRRGHTACATSFTALADECLHAFQDDLEAVVTDVLTHANISIDSLEAWICSRMNAATVDAHRRRRGQRGALQRPRLPKWLHEALGQDRWLTALATEMLVWVGVAATAGTGTWPLESWALRRAAVTGDWRSSDIATVARDVTVVQAAMQRRPAWYASYVYGPLGRKQAPVLPRPCGDSERILEPAPLPLVEQHELDDARLLSLASVAVDAIEDGIARGGVPGEVVASVLEKAFTGGTGREDLARVPLATAGASERAEALVADPDVIDRVVATVLDIIAAGSRAGDL